MRRVFNSRLLAGLVFVALVGAIFTISQLGHHIASKPRTTAGIGRMALSPRGGLNLYCFCPVGAVAGVDADVKALATTDPRVIDGISWEFPWSAVEPEQGVYDWSIIDEALMQTAKLGRRAQVRVTAGKRTPAWVPNQVSFDYIGQNGALTATMPVPWAPTFVKAWLSFITAYGARYANDSRVNVVQMPGPGVLGEMALPLGNITPTWAGWYSTLAPPHGPGVPYTTERIVSTWKTVIDAYRTTFPNKQLALNIGKPAQSDSAAEAEVIAYVQQFYPQIALQQDGLGNQTLNTIQGKYITDAAVAGDNVGWQFVLGNTGIAKMTSGFDVAIYSHARYVEVYKSDILNPDPAIQRMLLYYASTPPAPLPSSNPTPLSYPIRGH